MSQLYKLKKDGFILRFAIPFYKDALEWKSIFDILNTNNSFDNAKLIHIATLSLEMILKSILLLSFYNYRIDGKVLYWLKKDSHNIYRIFNKILSKYKIAFSKSQRLTIKKWSNSGINVRYKIDAFFCLFNTFGITSDKYKKSNDLTNIDFENYTSVFSTLVELCENIFFNEYGLVIDLLRKGKIQIPDSQFIIMQNFYK